MDFGVNFFPVVDPEQRSATECYDMIGELSELAEELGYEHVQTVEHYFSPYGGYCPDPVTLLTALAARTSRIRIVTGAVIPAFTHPVKLAGKLAMLDHISHGRLDVGFGRGFLPTEFTAFDVPMEESRARFAEGVEACRRLWSEEELVWEGEFHSFGPVTLLPRPYQRPHPPIFIASATSPESCAAAGRAGHNLQVVPSVTSTEQLQGMLAAYREAWAEAGHAPGVYRIQVKYTCYVAERHSEALESGERWERNYVEHMARSVAPLASGAGADYPGYEKFAEKAAAYDFPTSLKANKVLAGDSAAVTDQISAIRDALGTDIDLSLQFSPGALEQDRAVTAMRLFAQDVMPKFRQDR
ncbi:Flavin-dependent oxidoreductase, luciferase family (includes alkanesulfonate monooxygenase SsuD and methylene tetrahydromethanopterin reductase) [Streptomyces sp. WMMB 714]|nr:Flavin-dependent oxidoreductase, luciferase family (includes alkanesulfonate monooxygenase SsuD and methylene tetrahydromethanopterin reductase) [Streptomyces sp. WMMB 714]